MKNKTTQTKMKKRYPVIYVNKKLGLLRVINRNSTTSFEIKKHETKKELDTEFKDTVEGEWTPEIEAEMCISSGFRRIKPSENDRWELWDEE